MSVAGRPGGEISAGTSTPVGNTLFDLAQAVNAGPKDARAWGRLGVALTRAGRSEEGEGCLRTALVLSPDDPSLLNNLGTVLLQRQAREEAATHYARSLELRPDHPETLRNLATVLFELGRASEAAATYRKVLALAPSDAIARSGLLLSLSRSAEFGTERLFDEHRAYAQHHEAPHRPRWPRHAVPLDAERKLRIGIVSGDLRTHAVAFFVVPILKHLAAHSGLSLVAYFNSSQRDGVTTGIQANFALWRDVEGLGDEELAARIRSDEIDILLDLSGHTAGNRLPVFARKPAPLQASWLGYPGTTGLDAMDYYLADRRLLPAGLIDRQFSERIVRLACGIPFQWLRDTPAPGELPAMTRGQFSFGSFNHQSKLNPATLKVWAALLRAVPGARLLVCGIDAGSSQSALADACSRAGIAAERLEFRPRLPLPAYLRLHDDIDIALDAFPYNGGSTTLHALRMGVPTLTMIGNSMPARVGHALLDAVGLGDFAATDLADFVARGSAWASRPDQLATLRAELPSRLDSSDIGRTDLVASCLAQAFRTMWRRYCGGLPAESFDALPEGT